MTSTQKEEKVADITTEKAKEEHEDSSSDEDEHGHDHHGHDHDHDHDHDHAHGDKKTNKGEKKFKKAMIKLGMKAVPGINRVTIKKAKAVRKFFLYIDDPEVLKSPGADNTYIVFGEAKIQDFTSGLAQNEAAQLQKEKPTEKGEDKAAEKKPEAGGAEDLSEEGLDQNAINTVMDHTKCSRAEAVRALKETGGDSVTAIINLTK